MFISSLLAQIISDWPPNHTVNQGQNQELEPSSPDLPTPHAVTLPDYTPPQGQLYLLIHPAIQGKGEFSERFALTRRKCAREPGSCHKGGKLARSGGQL